MIKIRMCICCRMRCSQDSLLRLQVKDGVLSFYTMTGRSFYICDNCLNQTKTIKIICKIFKIDNNDAVNFFKEIAYNGKRTITKSESITNCK